ncbi:vacuolar protein sorting-associated protein hydrophilic protein [Scheffersomyces xylosifermentans]|uniref:vacuolar protein sorting-associated protein hydrophilic protein n=1 Tax=Scheffersomyces xylosifermentans TaxID=1304137 RepID=UPI00315D18D3
MSWFGSSSESTVELDNKIQEATSEAIPNGELDLALALDVTDLIRSKQLPAKQCMRSLKKRLGMTYSNPNLLSSTLKLVDLCVKNCGEHFLVEIASKEFMDYLVDFIFKVHYDIKHSSIRNQQAKNDVGELILSLIKEWSILFENQPELSYVLRCFERLDAEAYAFPDFAQTSALNSKFLDTRVPPDWVDDDKCMICYDKFSMINRKHHCRACGGVFCQTHSNNFIPLVSLGISKPVRVCDNCLAKEKSKSGHHEGSVRSPRHSRNSSRNLDSAVNNDEDEDEELKRAIALSLQDSGIKSSTSNVNSNPMANSSSNRRSNAVNDDEDDDDIKAAIAASMKDYQEQEKIRKLQEEYQNPNHQQTQNQWNQPSQQEEDQFYNIPIPDNSRDHGQQQQQYNNINNNFSGAPQHDPFTNNRLSPVNHMDQHKRVVDLTQEEEQNINNFIVSMYKLKNDPKSSSRIHDPELSDLHTKVCPLRGKVTKSLIYTVERQKAFTELNNKISALTRLYEEYLDAKLKKTYGIQTNPVVQVPGLNSYSPQVPPQNLGYSQQIPSQHSDYGQQVPAQTTGYSNEIPSYVQPENTGYNQYNQQQQEQQYQPAVGRQDTGYPSNPFSTQPTGYGSSSNVGQAPISGQPTGQSNSRQDVQSSSYYASYPPEEEYRPSDETLYSEQIKQDTGHQAQIPTFSYPPQEEDENKYSLPLLNQQQQAEFSYPPTQPQYVPSPTEPNFSNSEKQQEGYPAYAQGAPKQSAYPSYPPYGEESTEEDSDAKNQYNPPTVSNNYTGQIDLQPVHPTRENVLRTRSSELPPHAVEAASARFPPIDAVEEEYKSQHPDPVSSSVPYPAQFPSVPSTEEPERQPSPKRFIPEPEPLIDI